MSVFTPLPIVLVAIFSIGLASAARIEINSTTNGPLTKTVITCMLDEFDGTSQQIESIRVIGPDQKTILASVEPSKMTPILNRLDTSNMLAHGYIDPHYVDRSFLTLTLNPVLSIDTGVYSCHIHYGVGPLSKIDKARGTLDVSRQNFEIIDKYLLKKINALTIELEQKDKELAKEKNDRFTMKSSIAALEEKMKTVLAGMKTERKATLEQDERITSLQETVKYKVAFRAKYRYKYTFVAGDILKFENVDLNLGNAYNGNTGIFTAPKDGVYYFSVIANIPYEDETFAAHIKANGKVVASGWTYDKDHDSSLSASATVVLLKGQKAMVTVRSAKGRRNLDPDANLSVFTGHLVSLF